MAGTSARAWELQQAMTGSEAPPARLPKKQVTTERGAEATGRKAHKISESAMLGTGVPNRRFSAVFVRSVVCLSPRRPVRSSVIPGKAQRLRSTAGGLPTLLPTRKRRVRVSAPSKSLFVLAFQRIFRPTQIDLVLAVKAQ